MTTVSPPNVADFAVLTVMGYPVPEEFSNTRGIVRATVVAAFYGLGAVATLTVYSVYDWLGPMQPMILGLVGIFLPSVLLVVAMEEEARPPNPNILLLAQTVLLAGITGIALPGMWTISNMRLKALSNFPTDRSIESALNDKHENVRRTACRMMFDPRYNYDSTKANRALIEHVDIAPQCLDEVPQVEAAAAATRELATTWHSVLLAGNASDCPKVEALDSLMIAEAQRATMIFDCALGAADGEVRNCCSHYLSEAYPGRKLYKQLQLGRDMVDELDTEGPLLAASFGEKSFTSQVGNAPEQLKLKSKPVKVFSSDLACTAYVNGTASDEVSSLLRWVFEQHTDCVPPEFADGDPPDVGAACNEFLGLEIEERSKELENALCESHLAVRERTVKDAAKVRTGEDHAVMASKIDTGRNHMESTKLSAANYHNLVESGEIYELSPQERAMLMRRMSIAQREQMADRRDPTRDLNTEKGQQQMHENMAKDNQGLADLEKATGMSMAQLQKAIEENGGEIPEEVQASMQKFSEDNAGKSVKNNPDRAPEGY